MTPVGGHFVCCDDVIYLCIIMTSSCARLKSLLTYRAFSTDPGTVIEQTQDFLEIPRLILREDFVRDPNTGFYCYRSWRGNRELSCLSESKTRTRRNDVTKPTNETLDLLRELYESHQERLEKLLGRTFPWGK